MPATSRKEQRPDLVPHLVNEVNDFFAKRVWEVQPLTVAGIRAYYREDVWVWRLYQAFRRVDRVLHRVVGREYPYILPGRIRR